VAQPRSRTLPALLDEITARDPGHELIVGGGERVSYAETHERARRLAKGLLRLGVRRGDKVALLMGNRPEWLVIDFAVAMLGATLVPISTWSRTRELGYVLDHCDATTLITIARFAGQDYLGMLGELGGPGSARLPKLTRLVVVDGERSGALTPFDSLPELGVTVGDAELDAAQHAVTPDDVAYILYTSGTTSTPKGVQLCHGGLVENMWNIGERMHVSEHDRLWLAVSLFWGLGCENALFNLLTHGGCVVLQEHF